MVLSQMQKSTIFICPNRIRVHRPPLPMVYGDIEVSTGFDRYELQDPSASCNGKFAGYAPVAGVNDGKGHVKAIFDSATNGMLDVEMGSNCGVTGVYNIPINHYCTTTQQCRNSVTIRAGA